MMSLCVQLVQKTVSNYDNHENDLRISHGLYVTVSVTVILLRGRLVKIVKHKT